jgi:hypothetical protein
VPENTVVCLANKDILQDGDKVIVRAQMAGTQRGEFLGFPPKDRKMAIQVVDIHEFKDGKIVRTWHMEDWMSGLHELAFSRSSPVKPTADRMNYCPSVDEHCSDRSKLSSMGTTR